MIRSGFQSSEFWTAAVSQMLALAVLIGLIRAGDLPTLQDAIVKCVTAAFVFAANAGIVIAYIRSRTLLKQMGPR